VSAAPSGKGRNGSDRATEAAQANTRSRDTYLSAQYRRLRGRLGHKRAIGAVKHSIIVAC
jgi:transposase